MLKKIINFINTKQFKSFAIYSIGNIASSAIALILLPLYLKYLSPAEYGIVSLLLIIQTAFSLLVTTGLNSGLNRLYYEKNAIGKRNLITNLFIWVLSSSIILSLILSLFSNNLAHLLFNGLYANAIKLTIIYASLISLLAIPLNLMRLEKKPSAFVSYSLANFLIDFALKIVFVAVLKKGVNGYILSSLIATLATFIFAFPFYFKYISLSVKFKYLNELLKLGYPYLFSGLSVWVLEMADRFFINYFRGPSEVGAYSLAYRLVGIFTVLLYTPFVQFWSPFVFSTLAKKGAKELKRLAQKGFMLIVISGITLALIISVGSKELLNLMTHNSVYLQAIYLVPILILVPLIYLLCTIPDVLLLASKKVKYIMYTYIVGSIINIILNLILTSRFGVIGASISAVLSYLAMLFLYLYWAEKYFFTKLPWLKAFQVFIGALIIYFVLRNLFIYNLWLTLSIKEILTIAGALGLTWVVYNE